MSNLRIEDYGLIGDMHTVALVGINGSIDWFCFPHFDSPSVFGSILDTQKGGSFQIAPIDTQANTKQFYWPETNVLTTRFLTADGVGELIDFMVIPDNKNSRHHHHRLIRIVRLVRGSMTFKINCTPAFNYAQTDHTTEIFSEGARFLTQHLQLRLTTRIPLEKLNNGCNAEFILREGESAEFIIEEDDACVKDGICIPDASEVFDDFNKTVVYWRKWLSQCTYTGRWREMVQRSALVLKLLTFEPTGAIVAAPTCSLPEEIGGERNWDYRYTWIRDAAFTLYGLLRIGFTQEAAQFMYWLEERCHELTSDGALQIMYGLDGSHELTEKNLDHLEGYKNSRPVRIGNAAYKQLQLDIYGELMDSVYLYNKYGSPISYDLWTHLRHLVNWVTKNWNQKDEGIWEVRSGKQHFVYSKLMCWVALDRGIRLADKRSFPSEQTTWRKVRDEIYESIMKSGWNQSRKAFTQYYGSDQLDASNLIMPLVFFLSPADPRLHSTLEATLNSPSSGGLVSDSLVYRYNIEKSHDGLTGSEGTFNMCSFWMVEALTRAGKVNRKYLDRARLMFEQMLGYSNHLGLYAEETGPRGEALGNFPQAFTHISLISAAFNLDRALSSK